MEKEKSVTFSVTVDQWNSAVEKAFQERILHEQQDCPYGTTDTFGFMIKDCECQ